MSVSEAVLDWAWPAPYCGLVNGPCPHPSPEGGSDRSAFIAYSSDPRTADDMRRLAARGSVLGAAITTWESLRRSGASVIFCDICAELHRAALGMFEVTDFNQNVLFELGYALAKGRNCVLLRNTRIRPRKIALVTDVRFVPYATTDDVLAALRRADPFTEGSLGRTILAACAEPGPLPDYCSILYLLTATRADATVLVRRALKKLKRARTLPEDPRETFSHQLYELAKRLARADIVVANLETKDAEGAAERNAQTCMLAGMALGLGKRVMVLQEQPAEHLINLTGVLHEYRTATQAREAVRRLQTIVDDVVATREEALDETEGRPARADAGGIARLDFGQPAAEQEADGLAGYFVSTAEFEAARDGTRRLFVGRRGTGKSANWLQLASELDASPRNVVSRVCPLDVQVRRIKSALEHHFDERTQPFIFESVWVYILYTEMARAILGNMDARPATWTLDGLEAMAEWRGRHPTDADLELDERLNDALISVGEGIDATTRWSPEGAKVEQLYRTRGSALEKLLLTCLEDRVVYVLIDNLDRDWDERDPTSSMLLVGLLAASDRIAVSSLRGHAQVVVFLREDIKRSVERYDSDFEKRLWMDLTWDEPLLLRLIAERIRQCLNLDGEVSDQDAWALCFEPTVGGRSSYDYILERTLLRPRHAIWYCSRALDIARRKGHRKILENDILNAERDYSDYALNNLAREARGYPDDLVGMSVHFCDATAEVDQADARVRLQQWCDSARDEWKPGTEWDLDRGLRFLYDAGLLGVVTRDGTREYSCTEPNFGRAMQRAKAVIPGRQAGPAGHRQGVLTKASSFLRDLVRRPSPVPLHCLHPAFWRSLDIRQVGG